MMVNHPNMHHGPGGNSITVNPSETGILNWKFHQTYQIEAACNIPGHYEAGMFSPISIMEGN
ncbi:hypothetical protein GCM10022277_26980 [Litoribacillus peritrichatus]|uniref:Uncharacterized protein n=1 Tax=Litoribacillus peritrichatus TaxID=718191 RepID=A0ABP7MUP8_9GAMM